MRIWIRNRAAGVKPIHVALIILLLLASTAYGRAMEYHINFRCDVEQQASLYAPAFEEGYASAAEIRELVENDTLAGFKGQRWRATLDRVAHDIFQGGNRADQVVERLRNPNRRLLFKPNCMAFIEWRIYSGEGYAEDQFISGVEFINGHKISQFLEKIPPASLRSFTVSASVVKQRTSSTWDDETVRREQYTERRFAGSVGGQAWLDGNRVPTFWAHWFAMRLAYANARSNAGG